MRQLVRSDSGTSPLVPVFLVLLFASVLLIPYLSTGYYFDDIMNSCTRGYSELHGISINGAVKADLLAWITKNGRFTPLGQIYHYVWYYLPSLATYRWAQVGLTLGCVAIFGVFLRRLGLDRSRTWLVCAILPTLFQIRNYHDPIASYMGLFQTSFISGVFSALLLMRYLRKGARGSLAVALLLYAVQLLVYEPGVIFLPVSLLVCWAVGRPASKARASRAALGFIGITAVDFAIAIILRHYFKTGYVGTNSGLSLWSIWAFICQTSAAIPGVYQLIGKAGIFRPSDLWGPEFLSVWTPLLAAFSGWLFYRLLRDAEPEAAKSPSPAVLRWLAVLLLFIPSFMIAANARYQYEVSRPGQGYLPVFFAYFGMALLVTDAALAWIRRGSTPRARRQLVAAVGAITAVFVFNCNRIAAREMNHQQMGNRLAIESALGGGLFAKVAPGSLIATEEDSGWMTRECVMQFSHKSVNLLYLNPTHLPAESALDKAYLLHAGSKPDGSSEVTLAEPPRPGTSRKVSTRWSSGS